MVARVVACCAWLALACVTDARADSCDDGALPAAFEADGSGARAALPGMQFDSCVPIDLDGKPPCEVVCARVAPAPDFRSGEDGAEPNFHMLEHTVYFAATRGRAKELGRIVTYDGPLDAANGRAAASHSTVAFVNHATTPPTLELRAGSCLYECRGSSSLPGPSGSTKSAADCRAACPPRARYRDDGKRLRPVR